MAREHKATLRFLVVDGPNNGEDGYQPFSFTFFNPVSPNTQKNTCDKSCTGGCPFDHPEWASAKSYDPAFFLKETNRNLLVWALGSQGKRKYLFKLK